MPITELPALPADYPLFDWADWPESYAALVPGGPTKAFEKACWNAMVEYVENVSDAVGLDWWSDTYGPEAIKMLSAGNARMTAFIMNSMMRSVNNMIELPWRWEYDRTFRGYIGRMLFFGSSNVVQDIVYPEYFLELVKQINKVVEILRGTSDLQTSSEVLQRSFSWQTASAETKRAGAIISRNRTSRTSVSMAAEPVVLGELIDFPKHNSAISVSGPVWLRGGRIYKYMYLHSGIIVRGDRRLSRPTAASIGMKSLQTAALDYLRNTLETSAELWMHSKAAAELWPAPPVGMYADILTHSAAAAMAVQSLPLEAAPSGVQSFFRILSPKMAQVLPYEITDVRHLAVTRRSVTAAKSQSFAIPVAEAAESIANVSAVQTLSLPIASDHNSASRQEVKLSRDKAAPIHAREQAETHAEAPILLYRTAPVFTEAPTATKVACQIYLYNGWDYPEWVNGGLWIKQAHTITQYENGELEVR